LEWLGPGRVLLSTFLDRQDELCVATVSLRADEGLILALSTPQEMRPHDQ
jgi:hypothetical protein